MSWTMSEYAKKILAIKPTKAGVSVDSFTLVYATKGGTVMVASDGRGTDSGQARDLLAILPADCGQGRVLVLWPAVNPELVAALEKALR